MKSIALSFAITCGLALSVGLSQTPHDAVETTPEALHQDDRIRYAKAYLDLAKVELRLAEQVNQNAPGSILRDTVDRKKNTVKVAEKQLSLALLPRQPGSNVPLHLKYAEEQARQAKREYLQVLAMENRDKVFNDLQIERFRLQAEVAQLRFAVWNNPQNVMSLLDQMHWHMDRLSEEVVDLQKRLEQLEQK